MRKMRNKNFDNIVAGLINDKEDFTLILSQNSQKIIHGSKKTFFSEKKLNPKIFNISKKIKKECDSFLEEENKFTDRKNRKAINYYNYEKFKNCKRFFYVDISSAYISSLKINKIISENLYNEINTLKKNERLISLGVLAYEPFEVIYKNGIINKFEKVKNPYAPVFFTACNIISEIMQKICFLIGNRYFFYWVDGIFFERQEDFYIIKNFLENKGYNFRFGSCYNMIAISEANYWNVTFNQTDKGSIEIKKYSVPHYFQEVEERKENYDLILNSNFKKLLENYNSKKSKTNK